jgi:hypothetical protein
VRLFKVGNHSVSDRLLTQEILETLRADRGQWGQQRVKLEKLQKMRQWLQRLGLAERQLYSETTDSD